MRRLAVRRQVPERRAEAGVRGLPRPFLGRRARRGVARLWGQVRPGGGTTVTIERKSGSGWKRVAEERTDGRGAFRRLVRISGTTTFRFRWDGGTSVRRSVKP